MRGFELKKLAPRDRARALAVSTEQSGVEAAGTYSKRQCEHQAWDGQRKNQRQKWEEGEGGGRGPAVCR